MSRPRCRFCFGRLREPQCGYCDPTLTSAAQVLVSAWNVYRVRGRLFDDVVLASIRNEEQAKTEAQTAEV